MAKVNAMWIEFMLGSCCCRQGLMEKSGVQRGVLCMNGLY